MWDVLSQTVRTLSSLGLVVILFTPLYLYLSHLHERDGGFDFRALSGSEQLISVVLAVAPFFVFSWIHKRVKGRADSERRR